MSLATQELEKGASVAATEAIKFDSQGARGMAITKYQEAIDLLARIMRLNPNGRVNPIYKERCDTYSRRIEALQQAHGVDPAIDPNAPESEQRASVKRQEGENDFESLVMREKPNVTWEEVIGLDDAKKALRQSIVYPTKRPDLFPLGWPRGMLLYGPPGTGKTMLAAATANEMDGYFINVDASSMMSKWLGEAEKNVSKLFAMARQHVEKEGKPVILFVDEVDSLLGSRNSEVGGEVRTKNQFLTEMDGVAGKGKDVMMYVIGATNKPWSLDWAFLRRFQKRIYVSLPTKEARQNLFELYTHDLKMDPGVRPADLAKRFDGYSASDIRDICQAAAMRSVEELLNSPEYHEPVEGETPMQPRVTSFEDFEEVMAVRKPSVSAEMIKAYHKWSSEFKAL
ncbi:MAG: AAA family ATPase [Nitrosopumilus sp.]|nr:AAA family ATPase [Nitrosopumilus sp.]CAI9832503.1 Cell division protein C [Nitrosopumilaceae archaeon]MDA7941505.1 AAA family ATPase [Nitrosopumilus sp.]MDA7943353.1 AAA family ATPase [Nitrosopumilus sp.]MDA7944802.1 AAA family ATPase [Nitrosopumilus sp.]